LAWFNKDENGKFVGFADGARDEKLMSKEIQASS
jgi:hypothetical protein